MSIYVGNVSFKATEADITQLGDIFPSLFLKNKERVKNFLNFNEGK